MIPEEAVEAAIDAYFNASSPGMRAALEAAAPHIRAHALNDVADEMTRENPGDGPWGTPAFEHHADWLRAKALEA